MPVALVVLVNVHLLIGGRFARALFFLSAKEGAIKVRVTQQVFRTARSALEQIRTIARKAEVALAHVLQPPAGGTIRRRNLKLPFRTISGDWLTSLRRGTNGQTVTLLKIHPVGPVARGIGHKAHLPHGTGVGTGFVSLPVGGVEARHCVGGIAVGEVHREAVVQERIHLGLLTAGGSFKG